jgi:apolipoprotein N-acyltransferase
MKTLSGIFTLVFAIFVIMFALFAFSYFLVLILLVLGFFALCWLVGIPITVKADGKKICYIRWTKFYPKDQ